jgi:hypothetical protein
MYLMTVMSYTCLMSDMRQLCAMCRLSAMCARAPVAWCGRYVRFGAAPTRLVRYVRCGRIRARVVLIVRFVLVVRLSCGTRTTRTKRAYPLNSPKHVNGWGGVELVSKRQISGLLDHPKVPLRRPRPIPRTRSPLPTPSSPRCRPITPHRTHNRSPPPAQYLHGASRHQSVDTAPPIPYRSVELAVQRFGEANASRPRDGLPSTNHCR